MHTYTLKILLLSLLIFLHNNVQAEIYKCFTSDGSINFTSIPCGEKNTGIKRPKKKVAEFNEDGSVKSRKQIVSERIKKEKDYLEASKRQRIDEKKKQEKLDKHNNKLANNCARAKNSLKDLHTSGRVYSKNKNGEKKYLSKVERKKAAVDIKRKITYWCRE